MRRPADSELLRTAPDVRRQKAAPRPATSVLGEPSEQDVIGFSDDMPLLLFPKFRDNSGLRSRLSFFGSLCTFSEFKGHLCFGQSLLSSSSSGFSAGDFTLPAV